MHQEFAITYLDTENVRNPVSTFQVLGRQKGMPVNETVQLDRATLSEFTGKPCDVLTFLREVDAMQRNLATTKYRALLVKLACDQAEGVFETYETYRLMLSLSKKKERHPKKAVTVYDRHGKVHTYKPDQPRINIIY